MSPLKKVLIADDDSLLVGLLSATLLAKQVKVTTAADAMQAVMFAVREPPDAIVLDIGMPGGTGMNALKKLHGNYKTAMIPVMVLSGSTDPAVPGQVAELGGVFVRKPLPPAELHSMLSEMVEKRATLIETVMECVTDTDINGVLARLLATQPESTETELSLVLHFLQSKGKVVLQDGRWYLA